jgi:hypothetical protein
LARINANEGGWQEKLIAEIREAGTPNPTLAGPITQTGIKYFDRVRQASPIPWHVEQSGSDISLFQIRASDGPAEQAAALSAAASVVGLLWQAIEAPREATVRKESMVNIKQLLIAIRDYADARRRLPPNAIYDSDGKPLLSWRVAILPFLKEKALYDEFHLDESWDSPHNRELIAKMPAVFANPSLSGVEGKTNYLAAVGKQCVFNGTPKGIDFVQISDGTSKTAVLVEADADQAVEWTKPADWNFDPDQPAVGLGHLQSGSWLAGWADGHVSAISNHTDAKDVKAIFTRNGREIVLLH